MIDPFRAALLLAEAYRAEGFALQSPPTKIDSETAPGRYIEHTTTGALLLYLVEMNEPLDRADRVFATIGAHRTAIEPDGRITVITYRYAPSVKIPEQYIRFTEQGINFK